MKITKSLIFSLASLCVGTGTAEPTTLSEKEIVAIVNQTITPLMQQHNIPGMSIAVTVNGKNYFFNYGIASKKTNVPVSKNTLYEVASVTKPITATLVSYLAMQKTLNLKMPVSHYLAQLDGTAFDNVLILNLATHTSGLPLFIPDSIKTETALYTYLKKWQPDFPVGTHRIYSNGIGLLGYIIEKQTHKTYEMVLTEQLLKPLGMNQTYINVPIQNQGRYAQGYNDKGEVAHLASPGLTPAAYGVRSTSSDLIRLVQANMGELKLAPKLQQAITASHTGYFKTENLTQDLGWEQYPYPATQQMLVIGNGRTYLEAEAKGIQPAQAPQAQSYINKTGTSNGFGSYVAFIPEKKLGIVLLANKNYPTDARVKAGYQILAALDKA